MSKPDALWAHSHVTERETAHAWPDGRSDDAIWEDCLWASAVEFARVALRDGIPATHAEAEALRSDSGEPPTGASNTGNLIRGLSVRYHWSPPLATGFAAIWNALKPGQAAVVTGKLGAFPYGHTLRRWQPGYTGGHAVFVARVDALDHVWWCDPLAPQGTYQGEWASKADLATFVNGLPGQAMTAGIREDHPMPVIDRYQPGFVATVKPTANVRSAPKIDPSTVLRAVATPETWYITGWVKGDVDPDSGKNDWVVRWDGGRWEYTAIANLSAGPAAPAPTADEIKAAKDAGYSDGLAAGMDKGKKDAVDGIAEAEAARIRAIQLP